MYPEKAIRELVANALIHQDFSVTGAGPMVEIFAERMEITNPGEPLVDTLRFIDTPPRSRNEDLAAMMRRMKICEEGGTGIDKVVEAIEAFQLPAPDFAAITTMQPGFTKATLFAHQKLAEMDSKDRIRACYQHACLCYVSGQEDDECLTAEAVRDQARERLPGLPAHSGGSEGRGHQALRPRRTGPGHGATSLLGLRMPDRIFDGNLIGSTVGAAAGRAKSISAINTTDLRQITAKAGYLTAI